MAKKADMWWPHAELVGEDGSVTELKADAEMRQLDAFRQVNAWRDEYVGRIRHVRIEVWNDKRKLYDINLPDKRTGAKKK